MFRSIDRSPALSRLIENLSSTLARRRGLPLVVGILLVALSFVISLLGVFIASPWLELLWSLTHHIGLLTALIGVALIEPLGK